MIQNDPRLYTGGSAVFNTRPSVNLYAQLAQRKAALEQAKNDAFDEYVRGLNTKITPAGVRTIDLDAFNYKKNKWMESVMKNKGKNDIAAQSESNRLFQEALNITLESKGAEEGKKPMVDILLDPNKRNRLSSNVLPTIASHDEALYIKDKSGEYVRNQNRKPLDYTSNLFDPQFDFSKGFESWSKGQERTKTIGGIVKKDPVTGQVTRAFEKSYTPEQIKQISLNAARGVMDNPEHGNYYQLRFEKLKDDEYKILNEAYQSVHGKEIRLPSGQKTPNYVDSPEEVAAAEAIIQARSLTEKGTEDELDRQLANQRSINKIQINLSGRENGGGLGDYDILGKYDPKATTKTIRVKRDSGYGTDPKEINVVLSKDVDKTHKDMIGVKPIISADGSDYYIKLDNGDWEGIGGQIIKWDVVAQKELDKVNLNELKRGRQNLGSTKPNVPQPAKKEIKRSDIATKAAAAGYTEKEYEALLKKNNIKIIN